ncbi:YfhO family protein [Patescibacteria group bacterium]|nr:YfhO family protein [Patescibacteria group bacterium]
MLTLLIIFFNQAIFNNKTLVPLDILTEFDLVFKDDNLSQNFLISDIVNQFYPNYNFIYESIHNGEFPLWNPHVLTGIPFFADSQVSMFEFTHLLSYIFNISPLSFSLFSAIILLFILGLSFFTYLDNLKFTKTISLFGAVALMFSGTIIVWLNYPLMTAFIWLPFILLCVDKVVLNKKLIFFPYLSIAIFLMFLAGYPQIAIINLLIAFLYFLFRLIQNKVFNIKIILVFIVFLSLGVGMSAVQTGPSWDFIKKSESYEFGRDYTENNNFIKETKQQFSNFKYNLINGFEKTAKYGILAISSEHYGSPLDRDYKNPDNNPYGNFSELTIYTGIFTILFAVISIVWIRKNKIIIFWLSTAIISFSLAVNLPFLSLFKYLPLINKISVSRFRLVFIFSIVILAVYSMQEIYNYLKNKNYKIATGLIIIIILVSFLDLFYFFGTYNTGVKKDDSFIFENNAINFLQKNTDYERIVGLGILEGGFHSPIVPNTSMLTDLYDVRGYNPIIDKRYTNFADKYLSRRGSFVLADAIFNEKIIDLMSIKYIICPKSGCLIIKQNEELKKEYEDNNIDIFRNTKFLPRSYVAYNFINNQTANHALNLLESNSFNPYSEIIINDTNLLNQNIKDDDKSLIQEAKIIKYLNNEVVINVEAEKKGVLVLTDAYDDDWKVIVNSEEKKIMLVNGIFRGVIVNEGKSEVIFKYIPKNFYNYLFISIFSLISLIILILIIIKKPKMIRSFCSKLFISIFFTSRVKKK